MDKVHTLESVAEWSAARQTLGKRIVATNGCFDVLHIGHIRHLQEARTYGDELVVAINDDASVRALKGADRPVNPEHERAEMLAALACVDAVVLFSGTRCPDALRAINPNVYVKGGDYTIESLDPGERHALEECKAEIVILSLLPGHSTTAIIEHIRK